MWFFSDLRRQHILKSNPVEPQTWAQVLARLPILDGLEPEQLQLLCERAVLFVHQKHINYLPGVDLNEVDRLTLAAQAELPLLALSEGLNWYQGFHEILLYPDDFLSPQRNRDASGVVHEWEGAHSGEAWLQGPIILSYPGVRSSGDWHAYNLVIHELAHKLDMLNGSANGLPPLHDNMPIQTWATVMQTAFDQLNQTLNMHPHATPPIDAYAAENPAEFFAVCSEYFFSGPDLLHSAFPHVYEQMSLFYRQDPLARLKQLHSTDPHHRTHVDRSAHATNS